MCTIEDGIHTADLQGDRTTRLVGTRAFAQAVIDRLGQMPHHFAPMRYVNPSLPSGDAAPMS